MSEKKMNINQCYTLISAYVWLGGCLKAIFTSAYGLCKYYRTIYSIDNTSYKICIL